MTLFDNHNILAFNVFQNEKPIKLNRKEVFVILFEVEV